MAAVIDRSRKAIPIPVPAPVGGLNARDSLATMPAQDASTLENLFPYADKVGTRPGFASFVTATAISNITEGFYGLMRWNGTTGDEKLFAVYFFVEQQGGVRWGKVRIYRVNSGGTLTTEVTITSGASAEIRVGEWTQFTSGSGTKYLIFPTITDDGNGGGTVTLVIRTYDGTSWSTTSITDLPSNTTSCHSHRNRLWFYGHMPVDGPIAASNPLSAYYLPIGAVSGAAVEFNVGPYATKGGQIVAMRTWTLDGGTGGADDLAVFITDKGQAIAYSGTDPSASATWQLVGVFDVGRIASPYRGRLPFATGGGSRAPTFTWVSRDCFAMKYGADVLMWTENGIETAARTLRPSQVPTISDKIKPLLADAFKSYGAQAGLTDNGPWKMIEAPFLKALYISFQTAYSTTGSAPDSRVATSTVYAMNVDTGAWTKYSATNIVDAAMWGDSLYFVDGSRTIYKITGTAASDNGTAITFECRQAYSYLNSPENKHATLMQPVMRWTGNFSLTAELDADYNNGSISTYTSYAVAAEANVQPVLTANKMGRSLAVHMKGQTSVGVGSWYATTLFTKIMRGLV